MAQITEIPFERQAMNGEPMPDGLGFPYQLLFLGLRDLYHQYKQGWVDKETARQEKIALIRQCETFLIMEENASHWIEMFKRVEAASTNYRKDRTLENADILLACVEGRKTHGGKCIP